MTDAEKLEKIHMRLGYLRSYLLDESLHQSFRDGMETVLDLIEELLYERTFQDD